jgi:hypothetical protein
MFVPVTTLAVHFKGNRIVVITPDGSDILFLQEVYAPVWVRSVVHDISKADCPIIGNVKNCLESFIISMDISDQ